MKKSKQFKQRHIDADAQYKLALRSAEYNSELTHTCLLMILMSVCKTGIKKYSQRISRNYYYRPQTKFAKVMFLQVSVCPQGVGGWLLPGGVHGCSGGGGGGGA